MPVERTLILVKPDGVRRGLIGEILGRFEQKGLRVAALKMLTMSEEMAARHYAEHVKKPFYPELKSFITSGPCVAMAIEGGINLKGFVGKCEFKSFRTGDMRREPEASSLTIEHSAEGMIEG